MLSRRMRGLQNEHVSAAYILSELDAHFAVAESIYIRAPQRHVQVAGDLPRERRIGIAREQRDRQRAKFICLRHRPCSKWLGWQDSNLRMAGSKPAALPLGDTPIWPLPPIAAPIASHVAASDPGRGQRRLASAPESLRRSLAQPARSESSQKCSCPFR